MPHKLPDCMGNCLCPSYETMFHVKQRLASAHPEWSATRLHDRAMIEIMKGCSE